VTKRVALLCDIPGLWWGATRFSAPQSGRVDYAKLKRAVTRGDREIVRAVAWLADRDGLDKFQAYLRHGGYDTLVVPRGNDIDTLICNAAKEAAEDCDIIAIAASSGRYHTLQLQLKSLGCELEIWAFPVKCVLEEMRGKVDAWYQLDGQVLLAS
jgi:hypothetical protein